MDSEAERPAALRRKRLSLGKTRRRLSYERRVRLWLAAGAAPFLLLLGLTVYQHSDSWLATFWVVLGAGMVWAIAASIFFEGLVRPLQTLANIVAALREDDYSFRARGSRRGDALGDLALEINALAGTLQQQRSSAMDALALADRVMTSMQSPVLAFDGECRLRLLNASGARAFRLRREAALGRTADVLGLKDLIDSPDESLYSSGAGDALTSAPARWSVRRANFRLYGVPHTLFVLSDVAAALQEEERLAWQRLIRVLGHEINNSLTPIKSIASTLSTRLSRISLEPTPQEKEDLRRGLEVIEDRAESLNRFLQAYQQLSRLPHPNRRTVSLSSLLERTAPLERRMNVKVECHEDITLLADPDQIQQLLINLIKNAADAALDPEASHGEPVVEVACVAGEQQATLRITDNGPGLSNAANLFVPFYTTKPEGTGVGLTLCRQIAAAHRGTISLRNREDGMGCVAEVVLPLIDA